MPTKLSYLLSTLLVPGLLLASLFLAPMRVSALTCDDGFVPPAQLPAQDQRDICENSHGGIRTAPTPYASCNDGTEIPANVRFNGSEESYCESHGGVYTGTGTDFEDADEGDPRTEGDCKAPALSQHNCGIIRYIVIFIRALSALVGVVVVAMIIIGGIQYAASADNPQAVSDAKKRIMNAVLALAVYIFMFAFLQWVVPGGIF